MNLPMKNRIIIWAGARDSMLLVDGIFIDGVKAIDFHHDAGGEPELTLTLDVGRFLGRLQKEKANSPKEEHRLTD